MSRRGGIATVLAAGALLLAACGDGTPNAAPTSPTPSATVTTPSPTASQTAGPAVAVADNEYRPAELTVASGTTVVWTHEGTAAHSVTAKDSTFDSSPECNRTVGLAQCLQPGQTYAHAFTTPGRFAYSCRIHGDLMAGVVVVT